MHQLHLTLDEDRYIRRRASKLKRITELRSTIAEAIAWSELGFSSSGIAKRMDTNQDTVKSWMEEAMARYGLEIAEALGSHEEVSNPEKVSPEYLFELHDKEKAKWIEYVIRHKEQWEDDWVESVLRTAVSHTTNHDDIPELESVVKNKIQNG